MNVRVVLDLADHAVAPDDGIDDILAGSPMTTVIRTGGAVSRGSPRKSGERVYSNGHPRALAPDSPALTRFVG